MSGWLGAVRYYSSGSDLGWTAFCWFVLRYWRRLIDDLVLPDKPDLTSFSKSSTLADKAWFSLSFPPVFTLFRLSYRFEMGTRDLTTPGRLVRLSTFS